MLGWNRFYWKVIDSLKESHVLFRFKRRTGPTETESAETAWSDVIDQSKIRKRLNIDKLFEIINQEFQVLGRKYQMLPNFGICCRELRGSNQRVFMYACADSGLSQKFNNEERWEQICLPFKIPMYCKKAHKALRKATYWLYSCISGVQTLSASNLTDLIPS